MPAQVTVCSESRRSLSKACSFVRAACTSARMRSKSCLPASDLTSDVASPPLRRRSISCCAYASQPSCSERTRLSRSVWVGLSAVCWTRSCTCASSCGLATWYGARKASSPVITYPRTPVSMSDCKVVSSFNLPITWWVWSTHPVTFMKYRKNATKAPALTRPTISGNVTLRRAMRLNWSVSMAEMGMGGDPGRLRACAIIGGARRRAGRASPGRRRKRRPGWASARPFGSHGNQRAWHFGARVDGSGNARRPGDVWYGKRRLRQALHREVPARRAPPPPT